jgi:hypothetical protein
MPRGPGASAIVSETLSSRDKGGTPDGPPFERNERVWEVAVAVKKLL